MKQQKQFFKVVKGNDGKLKTVKVGKGPIGGMILTGNDPISQSVKEGDDIELDLSTMKFFIIRELTPGEKLRKKIFSLILDILLFPILIPAAIYAGIKISMTKKVLREGGKL